MMYRGNGVLERWLGAVVVLGLVLIAAPEVASAQVPPRLTQQGRLVDDAGQPVTGSVEMTFTIFDAETGGSIMWEGTSQTQLDDAGFYAVTLGTDSNPITAGVLSGGDRWIGISVDGESLDPRLPINSVPYAAVAGNAQSVADGSIGAAALADDFSVDASQVTEVEWSSIANVPGGLSDTLGGMSCSEGDVARYVSGSWTCTAGVDAASTLGGMSCADGQTVAATSSGWDCAALPSYDGTDFATSDQACPTGQTAVGVNADGTLDCQESKSAWVDGGASGAVISKVTVSAKANCGSDNPAEMEVFVNGVSVATHTISGSSFATYDATLTKPAYAEEIAVAFTNDGEQNGCNVNLSVESIELDTGVTIASTDTERVIYDKSGYFDRQDVVPGRVDMPWRGALRFFLAPTTSHSNPIICSANRSVDYSSGNYYEVAFTAAECGGRLPDSNYIGMLAKASASGPDEDWRVKQPQERNGPGVGFWDSNLSGRSPNVQVVFIPK